MKARINITNPSASGRRTGWWKHVTAVDTSKDNGYALSGSFLKEGLHDLPVGSILVEKAPCGSVKNWYNTGTVYKVEADGSLTELFECQSWERKFLELRDAIEQALAGSSKGDQERDALLARRAELLAELADIDRALEGQS